jgi:hypothetical protein
MDAFISRGMVGRSSTTKDWFKSTDRFEQEIGARVNRQDRQLTFADCFKSAGCTTDSDSPSHSSLPCGADVSSLEFSQGFS